MQRVQEEKRMCLCTVVIWYGTFLPVPYHWCSFISELASFRNSEVVPHQSFWLPRVCRFQYGIYDHDKQDTNTPRCAVELRGWLSSSNLKIRYMTHSTRCSNPHPSHTKLKTASSRQEQPREPHNNENFGRLAKSVAT
jgi:hypothetical protein